MPIHDWHRVRANRFHHFHQTWTPLIAASLNAGLLPPDCVTVLESPPKVRVNVQAEAFRYAQKANRIGIHHPDGEVVAIIELISPGNKNSLHAIRSFARKAAEFLMAGVNLLIVDLFPPSKRDPQGIHKLIWDRFQDEPYELPKGQPFTLASYSAGGILTAYIENVGVGAFLPDMPLFLTADRYIPCPLQSTYQAAWDVFPNALKAPLEAPSACPS